jgi:glycosyltransferase involved in cell wall biosynthesis
LRIAIVSPLQESVPPTLYGGTERIVSYLTEALVQQGHDVTLFATAESRTAARLMPMAERGLRLDPTCQDPLAHHIVMVDRVMEVAKEFDVLHFHIDYIHFPSCRLMALPTVTTLHGRLDVPDLAHVYRRFPEMPLVSISHSQRAPLDWANWAATVHHGLPATLYRYGEGRGGYLAFLGRVSPEKGLDHAINIARRAGMPLKIAAKIEKKDAEYYEMRIKPMLDSPGVEFLGEISERDKGAFLGDAVALLFPIKWPEPFGLVLIEAMACGTPVVAFPCGAVPEILEDGVTGRLVRDEDQAVQALQEVWRLDRLDCRLRFEQRFTADRMALDYLRVYREIASRTRLSD